MAHVKLVKVIFDTDSFVLSMNLNLKAFVFTIAVFIPLVIKGIKYCQNKNSVKAAHVRLIY